MTVETAAQTILTAIQRHRSGKTSVLQYGQTMRKVRTSMSEADYTAAKFLAAANDR